MFQMHKKLFLSATEPALYIIVITDPFSIRWCLVFYALIGVIPSAVEGTVPSYINRKNRESIRFVISKT